MSLKISQNNYHIQSENFIKFVENCTDSSQIKNITELAKKIPDLDIKNSTLVRIHNIVESRNGGASFDAKLQNIEACNNPFEQAERFINLSTDADTNQIGKIIEVAVRVLPKHRDVLKEKYVTTLRMLANSSLHKNNFFASFQATNALPQMQDPAQSLREHENLAASMNLNGPHYLSQNGFLPKQPENLAPSLNGPHYLAQDRFMPKKPVNTPLNVPQYFPQNKIEPKQPEIKVEQKGNEDIERLKQCAEACMQLHISDYIEDMTEEAYNPENAQHEELRKDYLKNMNGLKFINEFEKYVYQKFPSFKNKEELLNDFIAKSLFALFQEPEVKLPVNKFSALTPLVEKYLNEQINLIKKVSVVDYIEQLEDKKNNWASEKDFLEFMRKEAAVIYPIAYQGGNITEKSLEQDVKEYIQKVNPFK